MLAETVAEVMEVEVEEKVEVEEVKVEEMKAETKDPPAQAPQEQSHQHQTQMKAMMEEAQFRVPVRQEVPMDSITVEQQCPTVQATIHHLVCDLITSPLMLVGGHSIGVHGVITIIDLMRLHLRWQIILLTIQQILSFACVRIIRNVVATMQIHHTNCLLI